MTLDSAPIVAGWKLLAHPIFLGQFESLVHQVNALRAKDPAGYKKKAATKRLAVLVSLMLDKIPLDPAAKEYWLGHTLGEDYTSWFRAKFFQQYRLFFRFHTKARIIVFALVNDDKTERAYDSQTDAYRVFGNMLHSGHPPSD
ncbi:MAG: type II toxin-antitoxin system YhaV family toxin [Actinomycetaceae bacterium]|nr:type II toxin-antitoxin system YhaV family toxin [Actinomycetaceae bacterium]